jgi:hypothetical protein
MWISVGRNGPGHLALCDKQLRQMNDASIRRLKWLAGVSERLDSEPEEALGATSERLALIAGAFKRRADMHDGAEKRAK